jgi:hypothetical protein
MHDARSPSVEHSEGIADFTAAPPQRRAQAASARGNLTHGCRGAVSTGRHRAGQQHDPHPLMGRWKAARSNSAA